MKIFTRILAILSLSILLSTLMAGNVAFADESASSTPTPSGGGRSPASIQSEFKVDRYLKAPGQVSKVSGGAVGFVVQVIEFMIKFIGGVALVVFMVGGILVIVAQGKEDMLERGKKSMLYAVIGLVIAFFSFIIVTFVQSILFK